MNLNSRRIARDSFPSIWNTSVSITNKAPVLATNITSLRMNKSMDRAHPMRIFWAPARLSNGTTLSLTITRICGSSDFCGARQDYDDELIRCKFKRIKGFAALRWNCTLVKNGASSAVKRAVFWYVISRQRSHGCEARKVQGCKDWTKRQEMSKFKFIDELIGKTQGEWRLIFGLKPGEGASGPKHHSWT